MTDYKLVPMDGLRYTSDGALAECPCCGSLDVGGAHDTVNCYSCGLTVKKPRPLQNAIYAWNSRTNRAHSAAPDVQGDSVPSWRYEALIAHAKQQDRIIAEMRERLHTVSLYEQKEVWFWQGDGEDYPESLSCPVVIKADDLREILQAVPQPVEQPECGCCGAQASKCDDDCDTVQGHTFNREDRYIVLKSSRLSAQQIADITQLYTEALVVGVFVDKRWPEFEPVWSMIQDRVTRQPVPHPDEDYTPEERGRPELEPAPAVALCTGCGMVLGRDGGCHSPYCEDPQEPNQPVANLSGLVEALEEIVKQYSNLDISHEDFRVHACRRAEIALAPHRQGGEA